MNEGQTAPTGTDTRVDLACHARVSWFDARQLTATALKTIASTIVGSMSGRRELMAALEPYSHGHFELADEESVWIDYIADCGDGWNASHSVAWLAGRDALLLNRDRTATPQPLSPDCRKEADLSATAETLRLPAGRALILGGDEVYPTASRGGYEERLVGPMRSARFWQHPGRQVYAIPGNHDWYDGLTSFVRLFCQSAMSRRWLGAWQTRQRRSYFAIALPCRWWLWGVDLALEDDFDPPQQDYFEAQADKLQPGDQLILAVPTPVWLALKRDGNADSARSDEPLERSTNESSLHLVKPSDRSDHSARLEKLALVMDAVLKRGATIPLIVTGDSHFYAHHRAGDGRTGRDYVVCGGGGAFTLGTTQVPAQFRTPDVGTATETALFPSRRESAWRRWWVLAFPFVNRTFAVTLVAVQLIALWLLCAAWTPPRPAPDFARFAGDATAALLHAPGLALWLLLIVVGFGTYGRSGARGDRSATPPTVIGALHGVVQCSVAFAVFWAWLRLEEQAGLAATLGLGVAALIAASLLLGFLFGLYLAFAHVVFGMHNMEVFSAQGIEDWKCFLRIRIARDGATVHPIGLRRSSRRWNPAPQVTERRGTRRPMVWRRTLWVPSDCLRVMDPAEPLAPELIEEPFRCGGADDRP